MILSDVLTQYTNLFGKPAVVIRSPARINLIGEHTDYNNGLVLPASIDKQMYFALSANNSHRCTIHSANFDEDLYIDLAHTTTTESKWGRYVIGVVEILKDKNYHIDGFDCVFGGNIPIGAGLSSSAALACGLLKGLDELFGLNISPKDLIHYAQKVEHKYVGVQCGIMDQFVNVMGKAEHAVKIDCDTLDYEYVPVKLGAYTIVLCDSQVKHDLAESAYNTRREECSKGIALIKERFDFVNDFRDVDITMLKELSAKMGPTVFNRCKYVMEENKRVMACCEDLQNGNIERFGEHIYGSHFGLANEYEVSCKELDFLIDFAKDRSYVVGARMMGGGFGGCTLNIVEQDKAEEFMNGISQAYEKQYDIQPKLYKVKITDGLALQTEVEWKA